MTGTVAPAIRGIQRRLAFAAAILMVVGGLSGGLLAQAQTGQVDADVHSLVAAHLNALLGSFWLLGLAWSLRFAVIGEAGLAWMARFTILAAYANWAVTTVKAFLRVAGVGPTGEAKNDAVFAVLGATVVAPTLIAAVLWAWSLRPGAAAENGEGA